MARAPGWRRRRRSPRAAPAWRHAPNWSPGCGAHARSFELAPQPGAERVDDNDARENSEQDGRDLIVLDDAQRGDQLETDAAGADDAEHRRRTKVILPTINRNVGKVGENLRKHGMGYPLESAGAGRPCRLERLGINMLDRFGIEFRDHAD